MEWINNFSATDLITAERIVNDIPEWARAEHMEASSPLSELWKLSGNVSGNRPDKGQKNFLKKLSTLSLFHSSYK